ncbi:MAG: FAD-binding oxidoreductase [Pseudohongiella sp.]|nr:FAD-binding oxidoreductase [Pseudohongiella sp.]MDP2128705.1 FAD-binding oxidoreductase [Pseudohongiella sp.]
MVNDRENTQLLANNTPGICFGNGRSYGDVCLNPGGVVWQMRGLNRLIAFDSVTGRLRCQSGVLLQDIQRTLVPQGWMLPVTPGTQLITVGGAIANDVHGKNHHRLGSFGDHVIALDLFRTDGSLLHCSHNSEARMLQATIGGLGLTGIILEAELQLRRINSPWLTTDTVPYRSLDEFFELADSSEQNWEHTVSWIDCLSGRAGHDTRGIFLRANHNNDAAEHNPDTSHKAPTGARRLSFPFTPPLSLVNRLSLRPFNELYYRLQARKRGSGTAHYESFFYPLDTLRHWNRMYGPRGFYQYQCVVPKADSREAIARLLNTIQQSGEGSFLAVLKTFGDKTGKGLLSFPMPGATLALDFPNRGERSSRLFEQLDAIVSEHAGRIYAAKDALMPRSLFESGYPHLPEFIPMRDPGISSALSRRLMGS